AGTAMGAGFLAGLATGVRYQNLAIVGALGLGLLIWSARRWRATMAFALGATVPLAAAAAMNRARLGWWNPVSKGSGYVPSLVPTRGTGSFAADTARMLWARVVDSTLLPRFTVRQDPVTGVLMVGDTMKKAWLQSAPWLVLALALAVLVWLPAARRPGGA